MNQENQSTLNTWKRVIKCANESPDVLAANPVFKEDKKALENHLPKIIQLSAAVDVENDHTDNKKNIKVMMVDASLDICTNLNGYGLKTGDSTLVKFGEYTKSSLAKGKEAEVLQRHQDIAEKARDIFPELNAKRGMPESLLITYEGLVSQYETIIPEPKEAMKEKSAAYTELDKAFTQGEQLFKLLMGSSINLKSTAPEFLVRLNKAAVYIAPPVSPTKINFLVTNTVTKEKITDFTQTSEALNMKAVLNTTDSPTVILPHKAADFIIEREGFEPLVLKAVYVKKGQTNVFRVKLTPIKAT